MTLNWADKRRVVLLSVTGAALVLLVAAVTIAVMYETPSCMDGKQNQDERGIDCGGSCAYLCAADVAPPRVTFARPLQYATGRADAVAYIENRNDDAEAKSARYTIEIRGEDNLLLAEKEGVMDLPARSIVPVFVPSLYQGSGVASRAFLSFAEPVLWSAAKEQALQPLIEKVELEAGTRPRVTANVRNASPSSLYNVRAIATIFDSEGTVIAASQTIVRLVPAQGSAQAVFTWSEPFPAEAAKVEVVSVPQIP